MEHDVQAMYCWTSKLSSCGGGDGIRTSGSFGQFGSKIASDEK